MTTRDARNRSVGASPIPWFTLVLPIAFTGVLWVVTGNASVLMFVLLGPVGLVASLIDGRRQRSRQATHDERAAQERRDLAAKDEALREKSDSAAARRENPSLADVLATTVTTPPPAPRDIDAARLRLGLDPTGRPVMIPAIARLVIVATAPSHPRVRQVRESLIATRQWWGFPTSNESLVLLTRVADIPSSCTHTLTLESDGWATLAERSRPLLQRRLRVDLLTEAERSLVATCLDTLAVRATGTRDTSLSRLISGCDNGESGDLRAIVGLDELDRPVTLDLVRDGPHMLLAGPTGSGKTEFLVALVASLAAREPPTKVHVVIVDFKGGGGFARLNELPHCRGLVTDLDSGGVARAFVGLATEVERRELLLAQAGVTDISGLDESVRPPRLLVIVDEFRALIDRLPASRLVIADLMARGRALGIHVIAATQRAAGTFGDDLVVNAAIRICLNPIAPDDAWLLLGERMPQSTPGRAAFIGRRDHPAVAVRPVLCDEPTLARAREHALPETEPLWWPALPQVFYSRNDGIRYLDEMGEICLLSPPGLGSGDEAGSVLGVSVEPSTAWRIERFDSSAPVSLLVTGSPGSGRSQTLALIAAQAHDEVIWVSSDPSTAWDQLTSLVGELTTGSGGQRHFVLGDDVDETLSRAPTEIHEELSEMWLTLLGRAPTMGWSVVATVRTGSSAATRCAGLVREIAVLGPSSPEQTRPGEGWPAGRGYFRGREFQVCLWDGGQQRPPDSLTIRDSVDSRLPAAETVLHPAAVIVLAADAPSWRSLGYRAYSPEEWSSTANSERPMLSEATIAIDGLTRMQVRLAGLNIDRLPPARSRTVVVVSPTGKVQRVRLPAGLRVAA